MPRNQTQLNRTRLPLPLEFVRWYYTIAPISILDIWGGYLAANLHYFSVLLLLRTLFAYWHKDIEGYGRGFDPGRYLRVFSMNMVSRGVGFIIRMVTIVFGLIIELLIVFLGIIFLIFWLLAPAIVIFMIVKGISLIG